MNTPNQVVAEAVSKLNEQRTEQVVQEAVRLSNQIIEKQQKIEKCRESIKALQVEAGKLAKDVIDANRIFGGALPANANAETLGKVLEAANKARQYNIEQSGKRLTDAITAEQDTIVLLQKGITELQEKILKLEVPVVTVEQVAGSVS